MINYYWIIEDLLDKRPEKYRIVLREDVTNVLQMINYYLCKKCKYKVTMNEVSNGSVNETVINLELEWHV